MTTTKECPMCWGGVGSRQESGYQTTSKCKVCNGTGYLGDPPPPKPEPTCATCRFSAPLPKDALYCRRYPPVPIADVYSHYASRDDSTPTIETTFRTDRPEVAANDWCGEHQPHDPPKP